MGRTRLRNRYIDESSHTDPCRLPQSQPQRKVAVFQSKILPQYQISLIAHFVLAGILLGSAFPKPCSCGLRRLKILKNLFRIIQKQFRFTPCFSPISERTPRTERRSTTYETIQHAPPQPGNQDPADRRRIRRLYRPAFSLWNEPV